MYSPEKITFQQNRDIPKNSGAEIWEHLKDNLAEKEKVKLLGFEKEMKRGVPFEDADEIIEEVRKIIPPVLSVPKKYYKEIKNKGFVEAMPNWTGHKLIAAVLGRSPYVPKNEDRIYFSLCPQVKIEPRFMAKNKTKKTTGGINKDDALFHGVVFVSDNQRRLHLDQDLEQINN